MKWTFNSLLCCISSLAFCMPCFSQTLATLPEPKSPASNESNESKTITLAELPPPSYKWVIAVGGGIQSQNFDTSTSVNNGSGFPVPYNQDTYSTTEKSPGVIAIFIGAHGERDSKWFPAYSSGVFYQHSFATNIGNTIMQYSNPEFTNYTYDWDLSSDLVLAMLKANIIKLNKFSPYVIGGIGAAFNHSSGYSESAISGVTPRTSPSFDNSTTGQFAYSAGAGIDFQASPQILFSAEYQYQSLGRVNTGDGTGAWAGQSLELDSFSANTFLFNVSFLFGQ